MTDSQGRLLWASDIWTKTWMKGANHPSFPGRGHRYCRDGITLTWQEQLEHVPFLRLSPAFLQRVHCVDGPSIALHSQLQMWENNTYLLSTLRQQLITLSLAWPPLKSWTLTRHLTAISQQLAPSSTFPHYTRFSLKTPGYLSPPFLLRRMDPLVLSIPH